MPIQKLPGSAIAPGTITVVQLESTVATTVQTGGGPKITAITVTNNSYTNLDDTAVSVSGGYIKITGTGFVTGCSVIIGTVVATSVSFISSTEVRAQVPAQSAGTYTVYLVNPDGGVGIRVNGLNYSATPTWSTTSPLPGSVKDTAISIQLVATSNSAVTFSLQAGSTLPAGLSLSSGGLLSGTVTGISVETTYNFTIVATDAENQDTPQAFSITINVGDTYYPLVSLHLPGVGTNLANNNTFVDSSGNNFSITRNGNTTQGTFSPFSQTGWGAFFTGGIVNYDSGTVPANWQPAANNWTVECWVIPRSDSNTFLSWPHNSDGSRAIAMDFSGTTLSWHVRTAGGVISGSATHVISASVWTHLALVRNDTTVTLYINGVAGSTATLTSGVSLISGTWYSFGQFRYGTSPTYKGAVSNFRYTMSAVYTANFTVPTAPLTALANTRLLNFATWNATRNVGGTTYTADFNSGYTVQAFSPFSPTASWSAATNSGSAYFDANGDFLQIPANAAFAFGTGAFTVEAWIYPTVAQGVTLLSSNYNYSSASGNWSFYFTTSGATTLYFNAGSASGGANHASSTTVSIPNNAWTHMAYTRTGSTGYFWINGVQLGTGVTDSSNYAGSSGDLYVGRQNDATSQFGGYMAGLRIVKGTAVYTSNFTPPTAPVTAIANTSLLLNFTNAGIQDATGKNVLETVGDTYISTTQSKFSGSSIYFAGTDDYIVMPINQLINFTSSRSITIELWVYTTSSSRQFVIGSNSFNSSTSDYSAGIRIDWTPGVQCFFGAGSVSLNLGAGVTANTWHHLAFVYNGPTTTNYVFLNGSLITSSVASNTMTQTNALLLGVQGSDRILDYTGYIQDLRISNFARYTSSFTAPTGPFPTL